MSESDGDIDKVSLPIGRFVTAKIINKESPEDVVRQGVLVNRTTLLGETGTTYAIDPDKDITVVPDENLWGSTEVFAWTTRTLMKHRKLRLPTQPAGTK